ncbi:MAG: hypothetical protein A2X80_07180 [Geobacteraceae bacterium GWB2_52_12]|nr:MAG: hypothetical protein A2X80_07180 [Geobacteraceae bacterium GWB2_52_12]
MCVCGILVASQASALSVTASSDGNALAGALVGSGISISNVQYNGAEDASGFFSGGTDYYFGSSGVQLASIGISNGIILTTGKAVHAVGENHDHNVSFPHGLAGDIDLGSDTYDAAVLSFDFTSSYGNLYFNFLFATEEVNLDDPDDDQYVRYGNNDLVAIFLDDEKIAGITVGSAVASPGFRDNFGMYYTQYDGLTDIVSSKTGVSSGTHTLKFAIADFGDNLWDSALFIQAGSLSVNPVPEPATVFLLAMGLAGIYCGGRRAKKK